MGSGRSNSARSGRETENTHADLEQTETAKACLLKAGASSKAGKELSSLRSNGSLMAPPWPRPWALLTLTGPAHALITALCIAALQVPG